MNVHREIRATKAQIDQVLTDLRHFLDEDDDLKLDMLHGETPLLEVVSSLLSDNEHDEGLIESLETQIGVRQIRKERAKLRIDRRKAAIASLMDCAQITKLPLPEATVSLRTLLPRPKVTDADQLPDAFVTIQTVRKPDLDAIKTAVENGAQIPGVTVTNGGSSLTVRRK